MLPANILLGSAFASTALAAPLHDGFHDPVIALIISTCVLDVALSTFVTTAIVARLWWMDRRISSLTGTSTNRFSSSRYIVIESGAISAIFCIVVLALFGSNNPAALTGLDVVSQLDVCVDSPSLLFSRSDSLSFDGLGSHPDHRFTTFFSLTESVIKQAPSPQWPNTCLMVSPLHLAACIFPDSSQHAFHFHSNLVCVFI